LQGEVADRTGADKLLETLFNGGAVLQIVQIPASVDVLGGAPLFDFGIVPVLQPAVVVGYGYAVIFVGDRTLGGVGRRGVGWHLCESGQGQHEDRQGNTCRAFHRSVLLPGMGP
jgi:hypothetical protein